MTPEEIEIDHQKKEVEYYASVIDAWFSTSLERDKSLLTLSAGGIGLLITLLTTVGLSSAEALVLYVGAIASFVVALIAVLRIFHHNRRHLEEIISGKAANNDPLLAKLDLTAFWAFVAGVIFTAVIGIAAAIHSFTSKEQIMANEISNKTQATLAKDSFNGVSNLNPATSLNESFNNIGALQPKAIANSPSTTSGTSPAIPTPPNAGNTQNQGSNGK